MVSPPIVVREVWEKNLHEEFKLIQQSLRQFPFVSMDTEFPGTIFNPAHIPKHLFSSLSPSQLYSIMKQNVDALNLIQLGLTLSDAHGNLPQFNTKFQYVWQFNFRDFDSDSDLQNPESISLLKRQGIDFSKNKLEGIDSHIFAVLFNAYGLGLVSARRGSLTWITFHGLYDYGFLIKILTARKLPNNWKEFTMLVQRYFGVAVYDLKPMARMFGLHGGLEKIAKSLNLKRAAGKSHQAGSDSLLTMQVFMELMIKNRCFTNPTILDKFNHQSHGLATNSYVVSPVFVQWPSVIFVQSTH